MLLCICLSLYSHVYSRVRTRLLRCCLHLQSRTGAGTSILCTAAHAPMSTTYMCMCGGVHGVNSLQINISKEMDVLPCCQVAKQGAERAALNIT